MKIDVIFTSQAFRTLESLPQNIWFGIIALSDHLRANPQLGKVVEIVNAPKGLYRMLIYRGSHRIIYEFDEIDQCACVSAVQDCRQKLPEGRVLKRDLPLDE